MNLNNFWKVVLVGWLVLVVGCGVFSFATCVYPIFSSEKSFVPGSSTDSGIGGDFELRMNEIECLRSGVDPYLVWTGEVAHDRCYPYIRSDLRTETRCLPTNAYPPWQYTYMLPLEKLGHDWAWVVFMGFQLLAIVFIVVTSFKYGYAWQGTVGGLFAIAAALSPSLAIWRDLRVGNYSLIMTALTIALMRTTECKQNLWSGVAFAVMMIKPHLSVLFVIPLFLMRRIKPVVIAAVICLVSTIPPCVIAGRSPLQMILEAPQACAHGFCGCTMCPEVLVGWCNACGINACIPMYVAMFVSLVLCIWFTRKLLSTRNVLWIFAPAVFFSVAWSYCQWHNYCLYAALALPICELFFREKSRFIRTLIMVAFFCLMQGGVAVAKVVSETVCRCGGEYPVWTVWSIYSLFDVLSVVSMCWVFHRAAKMYEK